MAHERRIDNLLSYIDQHYDSGYDVASRHCGTSANNLNLEIIRITNVKHSDTVELLFEESSNGWLLKNYTILDQAKNDVIYRRDGPHAADSSTSD